VTDAFEQETQLLVVVLADHRQGCPTPGLVIFDVPKPNRFSHEAKLLMLATTAQGRRRQPLAPAPGSKYPSLTRAD
jgi:hypothetical protein